MALCYGNSMVGTSGVNGDMFFISPDNTTILLSDGASGAGAEGKVVMSNHCANTIKEHPFIESGLSSKEYLDKMIWKINNELISISQESKTYTFGTLVICVIHNNIATIASIGDSPAYLIHENCIARVSKTQKTYHNLIEMGVLTQEQAEEHIKKLPEHMWSMFDRFIPMIVPVYAMEEVEISSGDTVVLCSDGVSDYVKPEEIKETLNFSNITEGVERIISIAKDRSINLRGRNQYDDITMVVYRHFEGN